ncbi:MAG: hypothetical protein IPJ30_23975 [Acidobacteria bacterium]|nr:hypothetical protein [Acidobacteriota bacterium]
MNLWTPILHLYFEQKLSPSEIIAEGNDSKLVYEILNKNEHPSNEFKRQQLPPTIIISKNARSASGDAARSRINTGERPA